MFVFVSVESGWQRVFLTNLRGLTNYSSNSYFSTRKAGFFEKSFAFLTLLSAIFFSCGFGSTNYFSTGEKTVETKEIDEVLLSDICIFL